MIHNPNRPIPTIVALTGNDQVGKSTLARALAQYGCVHVSTSKMLKEKHGEGLSRDVLLNLGNELSKENPLWILAGFNKDLMRERITIVDAVRSQDQVEALRSLKANVVVVSIGEDNPYGVEPQVVIPYEFSTEARIESLFYGALRGAQGRVVGLVGAQWGSEGKGKVAAVLAEQHPFAAMARSGSPNAGHRVELPQGGFKVFRHLPSAAPYAQPGTVLCLGAGADIDAKVLRSEMEYIPEGVSLLIDENAVLVCDKARALEKENNLLDKVGSTMTGVGGAQALRALRVAKTALDSCQDELFGDYSGEASVGNVSDTMRRISFSGADIMIEATQGLGLSLNHGKYPYTTSRDTGPQGLLTELGLPFAGKVHWYLVARTYTIRVAGNSGDLPCETTWAEVAETSGIPEETLLQRERTSVTNRLRRVGKWERGGLVRMASRHFHPHDAITVCVTFADYLALDIEQLAICEQDASCLSTTPVLFGWGPKNSEFGTRTMCALALQEIRNEMTQAVGVED